MRRQPGGGRPAAGRVRGVHVPGGGRYRKRAVCDCPAGRAVRDVFAPGGGSAEPAPQATHAGLPGSLHGADSAGWVGGTMPRRTARALGAVFCVCAKGASCWRGTAPVAASQPSLLAPSLALCLVYLPSPVWARLWPCLVAAAALPAGAAAVGASVAWGPFTWANQACWLVLASCSLLTVLLVEWEGELALTAATEVPAQAPASAAAAGVRLGTACTTGPAALPCCRLEPDEATAWQLRLTVAGPGTAPFCSCSVAREGLAGGGQGGCRWNGHVQRGWVGWGGRCKCGRLRLSVRSSRDGHRAATAAALHSLL